MKIEKKIMCRGDWKVYQQFAVSNMPKGANLAIKASTVEGYDVPARLYNLKKDGYVACFPESAERINYEILLDDGEAKQVVLSSSLLPALAKLRSKVTYGLAWKQAHIIRSCDKDFFNGQIQIRVSSIANTAKRRVLRGSLLVSSADLRSPDIVILDEGMRPVDTSAIYLSSDLNQLPYTTNEPSKEYSFSLDLPMNLQSFCLVASIASKPELTSFYSVSNGEVKDLELKWAFHSHNAQGPEYNDWFKLHRATKSDLERQRSSHFRFEPTFSIVVPLYNTPLDLFWEMLDSVVEQSYKGWELILVNSTPENAALSSAVDFASSKDDRVRIVTLEKNFGITGNTNAGLKVANGDFVCFFDHDDTLEPDILFEYVTKLNQYPDTDVLYCDEDKLFEDGSYGLPYFKPDFSIDQLRNNNYVCHMLTIRKSLIDDIGGIPDGYDGAQDHCLTLLASERTSEIQHVDKILYHWRATEGSTALNADNKSYATDAGIRAVRDHLDRLKIPAIVEGFGRPFTYRVKYLAPASPKVSIIIPTSDNVDVLNRCIQSILTKTKYSNYEVIIVENNSKKEQTFDYYNSIETQNEHIRVVKWEGDGFNFSKLVNFGALKSSGEHYLFLNDDTEIIDGDWLDILIGYSTRKDVGAVGPRLYYPDYTYQHAGLAIKGVGVLQLFKGFPEDNVTLCYFGFNDITRNVSAVTGACLITRKDVFESVGGFDEQLAVAFNDVDYCLKVQKQLGLLCVYTSDTSLLHYESVSRGYDDADTDKLIRKEKELSTFKLKWEEYYVLGDPYHNNNLNQQCGWSEFFAL